jgi:hypothetical protein
VLNRRKNMSKNKTTIGILILTMLVGIALIPAGSAAKVNASSNNLYNFLEI